MTVRSALPRVRRRTRRLTTESQADEHERARPGLALPVLVGRDGVGVDLQRQRGDRLASGCWFQKRLPNAVKSSGAVSPATRASASSTPVTMPLHAPCA